MCGFHCSSILHKSCTNLFHFVLKHLFSPKFLLAIFTTGFASDQRLLQPKSCCNSICHADIFLGIWRPPDSRRLQDIEKAKFLVLLHTVTHWERLYWTHHVISCYVSFLYTSEAVGLSAGVPGSWPNQGAVLQVGWRQREKPSLGKTRKPRQFIFLKICVPKRRVTERRLRGVYRERAKLETLAFLKAEGY